MTKAAPWTTKGVGYAAQDAAREARRDGKSLGTWLHDAIADDAAEHSGRRAPSEFVERGHDEAPDSERIAAVTARLERLVAQSEQGRPPRITSRELTSQESDFEERMPRHRLPKDRMVQDRTGQDRTVEDLMSRDTLPSTRRGTQRIGTDEMRREFYADDRDGPSSHVATTPHDASPVSGTGGGMAGGMDRMLEDAIEAFERRVARHDRRTDEALASFAQMMQASEARRSEEHESVTALTDKLSSLENKLSDRFAESENNPIRGALARLEARLDTIGKRNAMEAAARESAPAFEHGIGIAEAGDRADLRLSSALGAVQPRPGQPATEASAIAVAAVQKVPPAKRRLGDAIAEISRKQQALDGHTREQARPQMQAAFVLPAAPQTASEQAERRASGSHVEDLEQEVHAAATRADALRADGSLTVKAMQKLQRQMGDIRELVGNIADRPLALERIEQRLDALSGRLDAALAKKPGTIPPLAPTADTSALEALLRELGEKMEAAQTSTDEGRALEALQQQVERLSSRFEQSEQGLSTLPTLAATMRELFAQLETTRTSVEASAAQAAREVLRIAVDDGRNRTSGGAPSDDVVSLDVAQDAAIERTQTTLGTVHDMLETVVSRLSAVEGDLAEVPGRPTASASEAGGAMGGQPAQRPAAPTSVQGTRGGSDLAFGGFDAARDALLPLSGGRQASSEANSEWQRARFIDAARRAAKTAQSESSLAAVKRSAALGPDVAKPTRAGLVAKSRDYVAAHKRPVLMGIAAIMMVLGTLALLQRNGMANHDDFAADDAKTRVKIAQADPSPAPDAAITGSAPSMAGNLLASNAPASNVSAEPQGSSDRPTTNAPASKISKALAIPANTANSDPIETGSLSQLPSFAARVGGGDPAQPVLPVGLMTAANAGNGAAQYELGTRYAEGHSVPRDLRQAAHWLEKAADGGLAPAQYRLASLYEKGMGVAQDKAKARRLYTEAAEAGNPRAMHNLAVLLADGDGHPDYAGAVTWFRKAAAFGIHDSQYNLAILLARGLGTQQSLVQSYQWFAVAAAQNDTDAAHKRDEVAGKLNANDLAVAKALAVAFHPKTPDESAVDVQTTPGEWDGVPGARPLNAARSKISSL